MRLRRDTPRSGRKKVWLYVVPAFVVFALATWIPVAQVLELGCEARPFRVIESPDGRWRATAAQMQCGSAVGSLSNIVTLRKIDDTLPLFDRKRVFDAPMSSREDVLFIEWKEDRRLLVTYSGDVEPFMRADSFDDVRVEYASIH